MTTYTNLACKLLVLAACAAAASSAVRAADNARYISITGDNDNLCTLAQPCRTLRRGVGATPEGGELRVLNSGFYGGGARINKAMTITGNANTVFLTGIVTVDPGPGAVVALRDLTLNGQDTINAGLNIDQAAAVHIERCVIQGFTGDGIFVFGTGTRAFVIDSIMRGNGGDGLRVGGDSIAVISNSTFANNLHGIHNLGVVETRQNNIVRGNEVDIFDGGGVYTPIPGI